ncbi:unnamed protein product [Linum tenue]|uniref:Uncharacterized protein n=1 Tax=Linum tenue TaxID=586396 RepID=A0AAV0HFI4_9ROSI|nr:unnamed protein product [Linum tenue]CAI0384644.1 unnamed protein product [Linum tenue]
MADSKSEILKRLRCHHCAGPLTKEAETSGWTNRPLLRDSFSMIGTAVGGTAGAFYGFNHVMPIVQKYIKGPMWVHFFIGSTLFSSSLVGSSYLKMYCFNMQAPPVIVFASACAGFAGGAVPALAQLASSGYHAAVSSPSLNPPQEDKVHRSRSSSTL